MLRRFRKYFRVRYSLRGLIILVTLVCVFFGWFAVGMHRAAKQATAVKALHAGQVAVIYDYMVDKFGSPTGSGRPPSGVLRRYLGTDFFSKVIRVEFPAGQLPQCGLSPLQNLRGVRHLSLRGSMLGDRDVHIDAMNGLRCIDAAFTNITDATINRLATIKGLISLDLSGTRVTDASLQNLGKNSTLNVLTLEEVDLSEHAVQQLKKENPSLNVEWSNAPSSKHLSAARNLAQLGAAVHFVSKAQATADINSYFSPGYRIVLDGESLDPSQGAGPVLAAMQHVEGLSTLELNGLFLTPTDWQMLFNGPWSRTLRSVTFSDVHMSILRDRLPPLNWNQLVHLSLRGSTIQYREQVYVAGLPLLESLSLRDSRTTDSALPALEQLQRLQQIDLSRTLITDNGMATLRRLEKLERIELCGTQISDHGLADLEHLKSLRCLGLSMTEITDTGLTSVAKMEAIEELDLSFTGVTDAGLAKLRRMRHLSRINLSGAFVSDKGLQYLKELSSLKQLWLMVDGHRVTKAGIHRLRTEFPQLQITLIGPKR
jgi:hypothetical protein